MDNTLGEQDQDGRITVRSLDTADVIFNGVSLAVTISDMLARLDKLERWMHSMTGVHDR